MYSTSIKIWKATNNAASLCTHHVHIWLFTLAYKLLPQSIPGRVNLSREDCFPQNSPPQPSSLTPSLPVFPIPQFPAPSPFQLWTLQLPGKKMSVKGVWKGHLSLNQTPLPYCRYCQCRASLLQRVVHSNYVPGALKKLIKKSWLQMFFPSLPSMNEKVLVLVSVEWTLLEMLLAQLVIVVWARENNTQCSQSERLSISWHAWHC